MFLKIIITIFAQLYQKIDIANQEKKCFREMSLNHVNLNDGNGKIKEKKEKIWKWKQRKLKWKIKTKPWEIKKKLIMNHEK